MTIDELLVEMLHREVAIARAVKIVNSLKLMRRRMPGRHFADPPIAQALDPILFIANHKAPEIPARHSQHFPGFLPGPPASLVLLKRLFETRHKSLP
jgi:hypothetical protein